MMKVLINALTAKRQSGGGFQIAVNFIKATLSRNDVKWFYLVSEDVDSILGINFLTIKNQSYFVFPSQPDFLHTYLKVRKKIRKLEISLSPDFIYSLNSPSYFRFMTPEVMRFANAWVTNPNHYAQHTLGLLSGIRNTLYCFNQRRLMKKRKYFVTQSEIVKEGIIKITHTASRYVGVISNVLPAFFTEKGINVFPRQQDGKINIACVAAPYKHKNLEIIPYVLNALRNKYQMNNVFFYVTIPFNHPSWNNLQKKLKEFNLEGKIVNYGYCSQEKLIELYKKCDIAFLPTLLETFSASILEAMFFKLPIVASDFSFNKEVAGTCGIYFHPTDYQDAAEKITHLIQNSTLKNSLLMSIPTYLKNYQSYSQHIGKIIEFFKSLPTK